MARSLRTIDIGELSRHDREDDCWIAVESEVYDITDYMPSHPGGLASKQLHWPDTHHKAHHGGQ